MIYLLSGQFNVSGWEFVKLLILFCVILGAAIGTTKFVGGIKLGQLKNSNFKIIETFRITQNKYLQIIQVSNKYILISVSKDNIQFIAELKEEDIRLSENQGQHKLEFKDIFKKYSNQVKQDSSFPIQDGHDKDIFSKKED